MPGHDLPQTDLADADRCVKCGLCLPHCPTFALSGNEADSPRGRISLMQGIARSEAITPGLFVHIDRCLQCGACEAMCPSRVPFTRLMDATRTRLEPARKRSVLGRLGRRLGLGLVASPRRTALLGRSLRLYQRLGLQRLAGALPLPATLRRLNRLLPEPTGNSPSPAVATGEEGEEVTLFRGCAGSLFDHQTLEAAQQLLQRLGYRVRIPEGQGCCGALHQHNGDPAGAERLATANRRAFGNDDAPVLVTSSACAAQLHDYGELCEQPDATAFANRVNEILHFLANRELPLAPLPETRVALLVPCSHRNQLKQAQDIPALLGRIPGLEVLTVNPDGGCCGAAGSYMLTEPEFSGRLRDGMVERVAASSARILVTTNIGCSLQLRSGLKERGLDIEVLHPVVLLLRSVTVAKR
ncbi:MAG TPA: (Fe-S)-binding protein [Gammaproteobacteria bacterium]|nr:(Fe-S)-binding protein [Gammaproteobacteria bacterium]